MSYASYTPYSYSLLYIQSFYSFVYYGDDLYLYEYAQFS